jgi:hypothetical protein
MLILHNIKSHLYPQNEWTNRADGNLIRDQKIKTLQTGKINLDMAKTGDFMVNSSGSLHLCVMQKYEILTVIKL